MRIDFVEPCGSDRKIFYYGYRVRRSALPLRVCTVQATHFPVNAVCALETCPIPHTQGQTFKDYSRLSRRRLRSRTCLPDWIRRGPDREVTTLRQQRPGLVVSPARFTRKNPISPAIGSSTATMWIHALFLARSDLCHCYAIDTLGFIAN